MIRIAYLLIFCIAILSGRNLLAAETTEETLTHILHFQDDNIVDEDNYKPINTKDIVIAWEKHNNIPRTEIRSLLHKFILQPLDESYDKLDSGKQWMARVLAASALFVLPAYASEESQVILTKIIKSKFKSLSQMAIRTLVQIRDGKLNDCLLDIVNDTDKYPEMSRFRLYEELTFVHERLIKEAAAANKKASNDTDELMENMIKFAEGEERVDNFMKLDKYLIKANKAYAHSDRRKSILKKHAKMVKTKHVPKWTAYVNGELESMEKNKPDNPNSDKNDNKSTEDNTNTSNGDKGNEQ